MFHFVVSQNDLISGRCSTLHLNVQGLVASGAIEVVGPLPRDVFAVVAAFGEVAFGGHHCMVFKCLAFFRRTRKTLALGARECGLHSHLNLGKGIGLRRFKQVAAAITVD